MEKLHTTAKTATKQGTPRSNARQREVDKKANNLTRGCNTMKTIMETPIVWTYDTNDHPNVWIANSAATIHASPNCEDLTSYHKYNENCIIKAFGNNTVKGVREGDILANAEYKGKCTRIKLTQVMHVPKADGKILSLKVLDQKGFKSRIVGGHIHIM